MGILYLPQMISESKEHWWNHNRQRKTKMLIEKLALMSLCLPQIPHELAWIESGSCGEKPATQSLNVIIDVAMQCVGVRETAVMHNLSRGSSRYLPYYCTCSLLVGFKLWWLLLSR
jgi:hypothetical protein